MADYASIAQLLALEGRVADAVRAAYTGEEDAQARMREALCAMRDSVKEGMRPDLRSISGLTGGQAAKIAPETALGGKVLARASAIALAVAESNAAMGKIVAAPTAGACGILPGALFAVAEEKGFGDEQLVDALFVAAGVGRVIAQRACISGAQGGCQAECGSASAMAAAALVQLAEGEKAAMDSAIAFAMMNLMGLVCDPVKGLVEVPCVYRNVIGVANALTAADMALAGIVSPIPADEAIDAMGRVGAMLPAALRETGIGGCAACKLRKD
ncbi:MAG TPA: L-serine ammonia-lyase, iron-sulfur-dependent, subunit alpha [Candidatus Ornithocaccomicrobium faecavium]|uniref:L-serine dehydratase n=1 Tax=Candidatus Ornithocaccomicrobium faecavium TaxID=2840890 RepID=A0A9D1TC81_9FIRM|nr:L-serine ammonia-lyase, iron-sulfur-dependent, subunit alpha [Candidatus Ornithocaccomicrobium faecavium]